LYQLSLHTQIEVIKHIKTNCEDLRRNVLTHSYEPNAAHGEKKVLHTSVFHELGRAHTTGAVSDTARRHQRRTEGKDGKSPGFSVVIKQYQKKMKDERLEEH